MHDARIEACLDGSLLVRNPEPPRQIGPRQCGQAVPHGNFCRQVNPAASGLAIVNEERTYELLRREVNAMNITHGLRRALQVKSCGTATIFESRRRTWQEIADRVSRFAGALRAHSLGRGDRIAVLMLNQDRYIECYLAASWAGAVIVPLNIRWGIQENADRRRTAAEIEGRFPELGQRIRTVVQYAGLPDDRFYSEGVTPSLVTALEDETESNTNGTSRGKTSAWRQWSRRPVQRLVAYLADTWGIRVNLIASGASKKAILVFNNAETAKLHALIAPFVHPSMEYKLLPAYRGRFAVEPLFTPCATSWWPCR